MSLEYLLAIRAMLNIVLFIITLSGSVLLWRSPYNGITKYLAFTAFCASFYVADVIFISFVDVALYPTIRYWNVAIWNTVAAALTLAVILLGLALIKDK